MQSVARFLSNRYYCWAVLAVVASIAVISLYSAIRVQNEDDLLAFLPQDNPEVTTFYDINDHFGGLDVALVGIEEKNPFTREFLEKLQRLTQELKETRGLNYVLSLTNVTDFISDEVNGGIITAPLVDSIPATADDEKTLREKIFSKDHVVGNLISKDGKAVLVYCFLAHGSEPRSMSNQIRNLVTATFPNHRIEWGGNPFVSSYVYDTVQKDLRRLTPWAVLLIVFLMYVALRDAKGTILALLSTGMAIGVTVGLMGILEVRLNLLLGSMPIVLFAIGCAYSIHVLSRYYDWRQKVDAATALQKTLSGIGPVVIVAGITSAAAILSFVVMDIQPIRSFGLFTAIGILITMIYSLTFVPAAIRLFDLKQRSSASSFSVRRLMVRLAVFSQHRRRSVGFSLAAVALVCGLFVFRIQTGVDQSSFFSEGSPPDRADKFLREYFGAAQFIQLQVEGDMVQPAVLHELQSLSDRLESIPHVTGVQHVSQAISTINQAMTGQRRIPDTAEQVNNLFSFLIGDPSIRQLVTDDRKRALLQIKVDTNKAAELAQVLEKIQQLVAEEHLEQYQLAKTNGERGADARARVESELLWRLQRVASAFQKTLPQEANSRLAAFLAHDQGQVDPNTVQMALARFLRSSESGVELPQPSAQAKDLAIELAANLASLGATANEETLRATIRRTLPSSFGDSMVDDLSASLAAPLDDIWQEQRAGQKAERLMQSLEWNGATLETDPRLRQSVSMALMDAQRPDVLLPVAAGAASDGQIKMGINGLPVLHRGLARSVEKNQIHSLAVAFLLVFLILSFVFRSFKTGLMASLPTLLTLIVIHGVMGWLHINLDIGTSLLGSLILANGVDYAVHLISAWESPSKGLLARAAACAADRAGPAIWTTAATMFVGFFVLSLGEAKPLQNVTGLKAAAMLVGALASFFLIPVLARRPSYQLLNEKREAVEPSEVVEAALLQHSPENH